MLIFRVLINLLHSFMRLFCLLLLCMVFVELYGQMDVYGTYRMDNYDPIGYDGCCSDHGELVLKNDDTFVIKRVSNQGDYICTYFSAGTFKVKGKKIFFISQIPDSINNIKGLPANVDRDQIQINFIRNWEGSFRMLYNRFYELTDSLVLKEILPIKIMPTFEELLDTTNGFMPKYVETDTVKIWIKRPASKNVFITNKYGYLVTLGERDLKLSSLVLKYYSWPECHMGFFDFTGYQFEVTGKGLKGIKPERNSDGGWYIIWYHKVDKP